MKINLHQKIDQAIQAIFKVLTFNESDSPAMSNSMYLKRLLEDLKITNETTYQDVKELVDTLLDFNSTETNELVLGEGFALGINNLQASFFDKATEELVHEANKAVYEVMSELSFWRREAVKPFQAKSQHEIDLEVKGLVLLEYISGEEAMKSARELIEMNNKKY